MLLMHLFPIAPLFDFTFVRVCENIQNCTMPLCNFPGVIFHCLCTKVMFGNVSNFLWKCFKWTMKMFQMSTNVHQMSSIWLVQMSIQQFSTWHYKIFLSLAARSHIFTLKPSLEVLFCIYVKHLKGLWKGANLQRCLCPRHVILNAPSLFHPKTFLLGLNGNIFLPHQSSSLVNQGTQIKGGSNWHQIGGQMLNKFMSKQFNSKQEFSSLWLEGAYTREKYRKEIYVQWKYIYTFLPEIYGQDIYVQ